MSVENLSGDISSRICSLFSDQESNVVWPPEVNRVWIFMHESYYI